MNIDWKFGINDLLTKEHFWKTFLYSVILLCITMFFDILGPLRGSIATGIYTFILLAIFPYGGVMLIKREYSRKAEAINDMEFNDDKIEVLEAFNELSDDIGDKQIKNSGLQKLKEGKELTWRDVW